MSYSKTLTGKKKKKKGISEKEKRIFLIVQLRKLRSYEVKKYALRYIQGRFPEKCSFHCPVDEPQQENPLAKIQQTWVLTDCLL